MKLTGEQIEALAEFLCGTTCVHFSICLQSPSRPHQWAARSFFDLRRTFGVDGWGGKEQLIKRLSEKDK